MALTEEAQKEFDGAKRDFMALKARIDATDNPAEKENLSQLAEQARARAKTIRETGQALGAGDVARGAAQGATLGFGDEIEAGARSLFSDRPYQEIRDEIRTDIADVSQAYPEEMMAAEFGGGFLVPGGVARSAVAGATKLPQAAARLTGLGAVGGAGAGAGYSEADNPLGLAINTGKGALIGAALSPALTLGIPAAGTIVGRLGSALGRSAPEQADRLVGRTMQRTGATPELVQEELARLGPEATLADVNDPMMFLAGAAAERGGDAAERVPYYLARNQEAKGRLISDAAEATESQPYIFPQAQREQQRRRAEAAGPLYESLETLEIPSGWVRNITSTPMGKRAFDKAVEDYRNRNRIPAGTEVFENNQIPLQVLDDMKQNLDQIANQIKTGKDIGSASNAADMAADLRGRIDAVFPEYATARETYQASSRLIDAGEQGRDVGPKMRPRLLEEASENYQNMDSAEAASFRLGWMQRFIDEVNAGGGAKGTGYAGARLGTPEQRQNYVEMVESPRNQGMLEEAIDREERFNTVAGYLSPAVGSKTSQRTAAREMADAEAGLQGALQEVIPEDLTALANVVKNVTGMGEDVSKEIGKRLMNPNITMADLERMAASGEIPRSLLRVIQEDPVARRLVPAIAGTGGPAVGVVVED